MNAQEAAEAWADIDTPGEADLVDMLAPFIAARATKQDAEKLIEAFGKPIRAWLESHNDELVDLERHIRAYLQPRRGKQTYDLVAIYENDPILFDRLRATGCLSVNADAVKAQGANVAGIEKYASFAASTNALMVEQIKEVIRADRRPATPER